MSLARGVLYAHPARPGWGVGLLVGEAEGKARLAWADGVTRTLVGAAARLVVVDPATLDPDAPPTPPAAPRPTSRASTRKARPSSPARATTRAGRVSVWTRRPELDDELRGLVVEGLDDSEIGRRLGLSPMTIRRRRRKLDLASPHWWPAELDERLVELFDGGSRSDPELGELLGRTAKSVRNRRKALGLTRPRPLRTDPKLVEQIVELRVGGRSARWISRSLGVSETAVCNVLDRHGIDPRGSVRVLWTDEADAELRRLVDEGLDDESIAVRLDRTRAAIKRRRVDLLGVRKLDRRPWNDAELDAVVEGLGRGDTIVAVAEAIGRNRRTVDRMIRELRKAGRL